MASNIESMIVRIEANQDGLRQELQKADVAIDSFARKVGGPLSRVSDGFSELGSSIAAAGIAAGIAGITAASVGAMAALADLNDQAERLGVSVESLQEFGVIAMKNGSDFSRMGESLEQFTKRLGEAQAGGGGLLSVLEQYGVSVKDSEGANRDTISVLYDLSDVMSNVKDKTEQTRIATEAFGRSGNEMIATFSLGSVALRQMADDVRAAGLVIDEDLVKKAAEFDDAWKLAAYSFGVNIKASVVEAAAAVGSYLEYTERVQAAVFKKLGVLPAVEPPDAAKVSRDKVLEGMAKPRGLNVDAEGLEKSLERAEKDADIQKSTSKRVEAYKTVVENLRFEAAQLGRTNVEQEVYNNLKQAGVDINSEEGRQIAKLTEQYRTQADRMRETAAAAKSMGSDITKSMNEAILSSDSLGDSLQNLGKSIADSVLTKYVTGPAGGFFGDLLAGLFKFEKGGVMTSSGSVPLRSYASGGIASTPQLALYGEGRLPEAYVPLPDGRTIPVTMQGGSGGGSVQVIQHLNISTGVEQTTRAEIMKAMPQIRQAAVAAVNDAAKRGKVSF